jgi:serine/threonine-protein kinase
MVMASETFLGKYEAVRLLGEGGMGKVFLGRKLQGGKEVVIKVMHPHIAANPTFRQNFQREMVVMTRFRHPHAVALFDASLDDATPCIVMEYVPGLTLDALVQQHGHLIPARAGWLMGQICLVLQAAHNAGIIHRDLTPVNVMVADAGRPTENVKVMDFGLARMGDGPYIPLEKLTGKSNNIGGGTPDYICPEQIRGDEVDHRGDLYSMGVLLFKVLTGRLPFEQYTDTPDILNAHLTEQPPSFAEVGAGGWVPPTVEAVVQSCLSKYPIERPQSARELAERYQDALGLKVVDLDFFEVAPAPAPPEPITKRMNTAAMVDILEAWMPEQIAVVKLRGFVDAQGGKVVESVPGMIRLRLPQDGINREADDNKKGVMSWLKLGAKKQAENVQYALVELHMEKKVVGGRNLLNITVLMFRDGTNLPLGRTPAWKQFMDRICRELRAYLMSG